MRVQAADPRLVSLVGEFMKTYLPIVRRRSPNTVDSYRTSINLFLDYMGAERGVTLATLTPAGLCQESVVGFMGWLGDTRGNAAPTINHRLSDVRGLCRFLESRGCVDSVEYELIREIEEVPDDRASEFTWLELDEVGAVLEALARNGKGLRDRFLVSLLYSSGGRISEVLSLKVSDLKPTRDGEADVHFYGKGNKHRIVPLPAEAWSGFQDYAEEYLPSRKPSDLIFYVEHKGERHAMSRDNVERILRDCEKTLREDEMPELQHLRTHLFRRSRAMHLYQKGVSLATIQEWLGYLGQRVIR